jgi:hypothetical protein
MSRRLGVTCLLAVGCSSLQAAPAGSLTPPREVVFRGMCDASGAVEIAGDLFVVADDEENILRVYDAGRGGPPLFGIDVSRALELQPRGKKARMPELDLEAGTRLGDRAYWITSHGRSSSAKPREERLRFFATSIPERGAPLRLIGRAYATLLDDLIADPRMARFDLAAAATRAPKDPGGLNLEGMTATPAGTLLLGFRNPIPGGRALLVELMNPAAVVEARERARLGPPILLDLGGLGVRALSWWRGRYLVVAGPYGSGAVSRLFRWDGRAAVASALDIDLAGYNPEGTFTPEAGDEVLLLSDDGSIELGGVACKKADPAARRFRGLWVRP